MGKRTETFEQADSTNLGPDLVWSEPVVGWETVGGEASMTAAGVRGVARLEVNLGTSDHAAEVVLTRIPTSNYGDLGPCCRVSPDGLTRYELRRGYATSGTTFWEVYKVVAGTQTAIGAVRRTLAPALPETWRLQVEGNVLKASRNGALLDTLTDPSPITTGNYVGVQGFASVVGTLRTGLVETFTADDLGPEPGVVTAPADSEHAIAPTFPVTAAGLPAGGTYAWTQAGTPVVLTGAATATVTVTPPPDVDGDAPPDTTLTVTYIPPAGGTPDSEDVVLTWTVAPAAAERVVKVNGAYV